MSLSRESLERLYIEHERALYNMVYRWVWNEAEAQDIVQEAFVRLWQKREGIRAETVEAYAYRVAINLAASRRRTLRLRQWLPFGSEHENLLGVWDGDRLLQLDEEKRRLRRALDKLPNKLKQTLMLCEFSAFSHAEVAMILGIPVGTVGSRRNKALKLLQKTLAGRMLAEQG